MTETKPARWHKFPHPDPTYRRAGIELAAHWPRLHQGDCEPFPDEDWVMALVRKHPALQPAVPAAAAASQLQEAWRAYHAGAFGEAVERGLNLGALGSNVANKATNIYATYLAPEAEKLPLFERAAGRAEALQRIAPDLANAWYFHAQALGRYSQGISIARALAQGMASRVKASLDHALRLEPRHGEAHLALGAYHAAVVDKVGTLLAGLTYGASREAGIGHFEKAAKLMPHSAIARIEYADGLALLYGKARLAQATQLYHEAANCTPLDAMERLDVERAKAEIAA